MSPHLSSSARRGALLVLALVAAVFLSYFSIRNALAVHYTDLQTLHGYERATRLEPRDFRNWYLLGRYWQYNLEETDTSRAIQAYLTSLSFNPRSANTWMDLAAAYESEGNLPSSLNAYLQAKKGYPISPEVAWRYGNFLLRQGELDTAFTEMRHAVEADHNLGAAAFSRSLHVEPNVEEILDRVLPQASDVYVGVISDQIADGHIGIALTVWDRLAAIHPRLRLQDAYYLTGDLIRRKKYADARRVWDQAVAFAGLVDLQGPAGSLLWDGGFESGLSGGSFTWRYPENFRAVQISIDTQEEHSGNHSLRLTFDGRSNIYFNHICHYVLVQPSTNYHFSAWVQTRKLTTDQGIRFELRPLGTQDTSVVVTRDVHGSEPWTQVETSWTSGKDVQEMQVCLLRYPSDQDRQRIRGAAWIDDVALVPALTERAKP
jgi:tetratricopeptide (TPR) repeat protein